MLGHDFNFRTIRRYVILFGTLFNDIIIDRVDSAGIVVSQVKVPIAYGPKEKVLARLAADPELNRPYAIELPRMAFEITGLEYDKDRKLVTTGQNRIVDSATHLASTQYNPVPWNFGFQLHIIVKNSEDGQRILEQILPFFTPTWTASVILVPSMDNEKRDIPIVIGAVTLTDDYADQKMEVRRSQIWTLNFTVKGWLYGPIRSAGVITLADINFYVPDTDTAEEGVGITPISERIEIIPGQDANGIATSNALITVDRSLINANSDWDYIVTLTGNTGGT